MRSALNGDPQAAQSRSALPSARSTRQSAVALASGRSKDHDGLGELPVAGRDEKDGAPGPTRSSVYVLRAGGPSTPLALTARTSKVWSPSAREVS